MVILRSMEAADSVRCSEIAAEAFSGEIKLGMPAFSSEYFASRIPSERVRMTVADDGGVVGFMVYTIANVEQPAVIHLVAVDKPNRGQGIGRQLVKHTIDYTAENGWSKLKLSTRPWNHAMRRVCSDLGFIQEAYLSKEYLDNDLIQYGYFPEP
jgi:predicted GNAT family acetyltransferase